MSDIYCAECGREVDEYWAAGAIWEATHLCAICEPTP